MATSERTDRRDPDHLKANAFDLHEMLARVHAVLRLLDAGLAVPPAEPAPRRFRFRGWQLDCNTRTLIDPAGVPVTLSKAEHGLLVVFLNAPQRPLSRAYLLEATHLPEDVSDRSIDVQVLRLRRRLEREAGGERIVQTMHGVGYVFAAAVERT